MIGKLREYQLLYPLHQQYRCNLHILEAFQRTDHFQATDYQIFDHRKQLNEITTLFLNQPIDK